MTEVSRDAISAHLDRIELSSSAESVKADIDAVGKLFKEKIEFLLEGSLRGQDPMAST